MLFLTIAKLGSISEHGIYTDLLREFRDRGDEVYVVCPAERRTNEATRFALEDGIGVLRVRTGNLTQSTVVEKGISMLLLELQFIRAINAWLHNVKFDLVVYSTPPVTFEKVVRYVKRRDGCMSYLLLKDIFPQNAVDLGMLRKGSLIWRYFRYKEKKLYAASDFIGCMSAANVKYVLTHNPDVPSSKVEECPNSIKPYPLDRRAGRAATVRNSLGIPEEVVLFIFGGNLGRPQGIGFLLEILDRGQNRNDIFFLIVGSGTEYNRIEQHLKSRAYRNVKLLRTLPKDDFYTLLLECDVGLVFLDPRFTIPNFPSRVTAYMEEAIPIIAATDPNTDLKDVLRESGSGIWVRSGDLDAYMSAIDRLASNPTLRREMGKAGRRYLEANYTVSRTYEIITAHLKKNQRSGSMFEGCSKNFC
ncbi:glycosyltransferase family 4 protein [Moorella naiadis (nom. illeg.)]|uniref:glycosyltransferase family 4 protein n=1 Tax=Moorella naiadis (nom. illeg.) TaxID=3093670 RepID=UPI003D9C9437